MPLLVISNVTYRWGISWNKSC